ncbi:MAG TPA: hypothetical protein VII56_11140 [Rhizomicrobium sp.]
MRTRLEGIPRKRTYAAISISVLLAAALAISAGAAPPSGALNLHVDLATIEFTRGQVPDGKHYMSTNPAQAYNRKFHDVSWYSHDTVMGAKVPTLHYGAHNHATYAIGPESPGTRGTFWTPAFAINSKSPCKLSFSHSYGLGDASRLISSVDILTFSYSFDGQFWVTEALPKPSVKIPWTTVNKAIPCQGHSALWLNWDFNTVDGAHNDGRGWNLKSFDLQQD